MGLASDSKASQGCPAVALTVGRPGAARPVAAGPCWRGAALSAAAGGGYHELEAPGAEAQALRGSGRTRSGAIIGPRPGLPVAAAAGWQAHESRVALTDPGPARLRRRSDLAPAGESEAQSEQRPPDLESRVTVTSRPGT